LDRAALNLVGDTVRVDGQADIDGDRQAFDPDFRGGFDLGHNSAIGPRVLVAGQSQAAPVISQLLASPSGPRDGERNDGARSCVSEVAQAVCDRIASGGIGELVHKLFYTEEHGKNT